MILHQWFNENHMTSNPEKCHYIVIDSKGPSSKIMVKKKKKKNEITITNKGKLPSNLLDTKLSLENHISSLSAEKQKIDALARLKNYFTSYHRNLQLHFVIKSKFYVLSSNIDQYLALSKQSIKWHL